MSTTPPIIVVVDDDHDIVTFVCDLFIMLGMTVVPCPTDRQALACVVEHHPTLVILDFWLHDLTGLDILHQLRADPATQDIPVVFFTGSDDELRRQLPDYAAHNAQLVLKPNVEQLNVVVHRLVEQST